MTIPLALLRRVPGLLVAAIYLVIISRRGDQVAALFEAFRGPWDHSVLLAIALLTGLGLAALVERPTRRWLLLDAVIFAVPLALLPCAFPLDLWMRIALAAAAGLTMLLALTGMARFVAPGWQ